MVSSQAKKMKRSEHDPQKDDSCESVRSKECSEISLKVVKTIFKSCQRSLGSNRSNLYALAVITCTV